MKRLITAIALLMVVASSGAAQTEKFAPLVVQIPTGARPLSMGGWNASNRDVDAAFGNPAFAGTMTSTSASAATYEGGARAGVLSSHSTIGIIGLAIGTSYLDYRAFGLELEPAAIASDVLTRKGETRSASIAGSVATSATFKGYRVGAALMYVEERVGDARSSVAATSLGVAKDFVSSNTTVGLAVQNIGPSLRGITGEIDLPLRVAAGVTGPVIALGSYVDASWTGGISVRRDGFLGATAGGELSYVPIEGVSVAFRAGVRRAELRAQQPITLGFGGSLDRFALDYAWEQMRGGASHRLSLRLR